MAPRAGSVSTRSPPSDWLAYLLWVRDTVPIAIENDIEATSIDLRWGLRARRARWRERARRRCTPARSCWPAAATVRVRPSSRRSLRWRVRHLGERVRVFHSAEDIDFARFRGGKVGVLGASASAFDNAGAALEAGAGAGAPVLAAGAPAADQQVEVDRVCGLLPRLRRARRRQALADLQLHPLARACRRRTSWCCAATATRASPSTSPSHGSMSSPTRRASTSSRARRAIASMPSILATGFSVDLAQRPELAPLHDKIALWARSHPPARCRAPS